MMNNKKDNTEYLLALKSAGLKNTKHRCSLLEIIFNESQPLSAEEIFCRIKEKTAEINLSTVYRNLEVLVSKGLVTKLTFPGDSKSLYEYNKMGHRHYIVCISCKKIMTIEHCPLQEYELSLEKETGFKINAHTLVLFGYCPQCNKE